MTLLLLLPLTALSYDLVWFKRDLRIHDHEPLCRAADGPFLGLYIFEAEVIQAPDFDPSHFLAVVESVLELRRKLEARGGALVVRVGEAVEVLSSLHGTLPFRALRSHQETGNHVTFMRDLRVGQWCRDKGIPWTESRQFGIVRCLSERDGWSRQWNAFMKLPQQEVPKHLTAVKGAPASDPVPSLEHFSLPESTKVQAQRAGEGQALETLHTFLNSRGERYQSEMSSPNSAWTSCSRLSVGLAYGNVSMRRIFQETELRRSYLKSAKKEGHDIGKDWLKSINSFSKRLRWHCHFMQKLESQPSLEFENMARAYDGLRESEFSQERFEAYTRGETGYPMVDACIRCLHATGWVNFRMRAMLMSFASYHLWLHWRPTSLFLARQFLDFEAGIHYPQSQMQSGTTGINTFRIYSPIKQVKDQDPEGTFIRKWIPELQSLPARYLAQPELTPPLELMAAGIELGEHYPLPIVEHKAAVASAKSKLYAVKGSAAARQEAKVIYQKHGSRRRPSERPTSRGASASKKSAAKVSASES